MVYKRKRKVVNKDYSLKLFYNKTNLLRIINRFQNKNNQIVL